MRKHSSKFPRYLLCVLLSVALIFGSVLEIEAAELEVPYYWQDGAGWCWAASASMVAKYYNMQPPSGVQIKPWWAAHLRGKPKNGIPYWDEASGRWKIGDEAGGGWEDYQAVLAQMDPVRTYTENRIWINSSAKNDIISKLDDGHPVLLRSWDSGVGRHAMVLVGCDGANDTDNVYINEPSGAIFKGSSNNRLCYVEKT